MKKRAWQGLTTKVLVIIVLPITAVLLFVAFGSLSLHRNAMRELVGERDQRTASSTANALREQLNHRAAAVQGLSTGWGDNEQKLHDISSSIDFLLPDFDIGLAIYSEDGYELMLMEGDELLWQALENEVGHNLADYKEFRKTNPKVYFSVPYLHPAYNNYLVSVIFQEDTSSPIVVGVFNLTNLARQIFSGISSEEDDLISLLTDNAGQILYIEGAVALETAPLEHPGVLEALQGKDGTTYVTIDFSEHVIAYSSVEPTGWALIIEEPWDSVASPLLRFTELGPLILIPIIIFALSALWLSASQIIQPLKRLEIQASELEWGNYDAVKEDVGGIAEIESLQRTLIHLSDRIKRSYQGLRGYIGSITDAQEEERLRLARELHDETLQSLIALNQKIQLLKRNSEAVTILDPISDLEDMVIEMMQEIRRFTKALRPLYLEDLGLIAALDMLTKETMERAEIKIGFQVTGKERRLHDHLEIAIYRIAQEALSNIIRHANATSSKVEVYFMDNLVELKISDNGQGFVVPGSPSDLASSGHFGLLGIYERAELIGASCSIDSNEELGSQVTISIDIASLE